MTFKDKVEEILGKIEVPPGVGYLGFGFPTIKWKSDSLRFIIEYTEREPEGLSIKSYTLQTPDITIYAYNLITYSKFRIYSKSLTIPDLTFKKVPDIFTDEDAILRFIADVRDYGIKAFTKLISDILSENV